MPYKAVGNSVFVFKNGRWRLHKRRPSHKAAVKYAAALNINAHKK